MELSNWLKIALNKLRGALRRPSAETESASSTQYSLLARFIFQEGHYRKKDPAAPKPGAFLPKPSDLKISAMWRDQLSEREIWSLGDLVGSTRSKPPLARADFDVGAVSEAKLAIEPDPKPHPRHVNVSGWPADKAEQKSIALLLCHRSALIIKMTKP
ncbi:MAG: hypothetical protein ABSH13_02255 [Candidatus Acidiferrum sp.]|jgi:hypothetical protein